MPINKKLIGRIHRFETLFQNNQLKDFESNELLNLANRFSKIENDFKENSNQKLIRKKIAIVSSSTSYFFMNVLKLFCYQYKIAPEFNEAEYGAIHEQILNDDSELYSFAPDILLILPDYRDIKEKPSLFSDNSEIEEWVSSQYIVYNNLWSKVSSKLHKCQIFQALFVVPHYRSMGALEGNYIFSPQNYLRLLNLELIKNKSSNVTFIDFDYHASNFGKSRWFDDSQFFQSKQTISFDALSEICHATARLISSYFGKMKKCLVLDLDNTLWGGVIGDDDLKGININSHDPEGEAFLAFQDYLKSLKERGVILAVCSKNEEKIAQIPFKKHPEMILKLNDISCFKANWEDKVSNIQAIAEELNIGLDSIVFFDDNPAERELVKEFLPEVEVIDTQEDPALYISELDRARCFDWAQLTLEDVERSASFVQNKKRIQLQKSIVDYDDYLKSLGMEASIGNISSINIVRFSQLINKTNQFNLRTKRFTEAEIETMSKNSKKFKLIYISLKDKFGSYGLISSIILEKKNNTVFINTWVMSCRVFKRGIEGLALSAIIEVANKWDCNMIVGEHIPTDKNIILNNLYSDLGFDRIKKNSLDNYTFEGTPYYQKTSSTKYNTSHHISLKHE